VGYGARRRDVGARGPTGLRAAAAAPRGRVPGRARV